MTDAGVHAHDLPFTLDGGRRTFRGALSLVDSPLDRLETSVREFLGPAEIRLLTPSLHARRRHSLLLGRRAAKRALARLHPEVSPLDFAILPGVLDQPVVTGPGAGGLQVTVSHAGAIGVAIAFPEACPMGIDLELIDPGHRETLRGQVDAGELDRVARVLGDADRGLFLAWCLKEALSKALRCGLTVPFDVLEFSSVDPLGPGAVVEFTNFGQYAGYGACVGGVALAAVCPRNVEWRFDEGGDPPSALASILAPLRAAREPEEVS